MIRVVEDKQEKEKIATAILHNLPEWFGLPDSTKTYIEESKELPFLAYKKDGIDCGFIVLKSTSKDTAEIYVMGVLKDFHRQGIGKALFENFEKMAIEQGFGYLQVKTVKMGHYKEYDITNRFYESLGFKELECFPTLWDAWNPCQIYIKYITN